MTRIGIDLEQFVTDPYGSGIQRVLQFLAKAWPADAPEAIFVIPDGERFQILGPEAASEILSIPFAENEDPSIGLRERIFAALRLSQGTKVSQAQLLGMLDSWLLPEVTYLPSVHQRFRMMAACMPAAMIGYDALPMTEPANYRFRPGTAARVSEYFRLLASAQSVVCISEYSRATLWDRLRRDRALRTTVAHPGGDHIAPVATKTSSVVPPADQVRFLRVGTMEARKQPVEIAEAFARARGLGASATLTFIGRPSASDAAINSALAAAVHANIGIEWIVEANDALVRAHLRETDVFLSTGVEGYGIPVLEALTQGTPVLYSGIQPAAELMDGKGANRIPGESVEQLSESMLLWSDRQRIHQLTESIDMSAIPTWEAFVRGVVAACLP